MQSGNPNGLQMIGSPLHCVAVRLRREAFGVPAAALSKLQIPAAVSFPLHGDGIIRIGSDDQAGIEFRRLPILKEGGSPKSCRADRYRGTRSDQNAARRFQLLHRFSLQQKQRISRPSA